MIRWTYCTIYNTKSDSRNADSIDLVVTLSWHMISLPMETTDDLFDCNIITYMPHKCKWFTGNVILIYLFVSASSANFTEQDLLQTLLRDYNTNARSVWDPSESVEVAIGVAMKQIVDLVSVSRPLNCHDCTVKILFNEHPASPILLSPLCNGWNSL